MVSLFKKIFAKPIKVLAPATGKLIPLTSVSDEMFAQKMMGDGYAVKPIENEIYSPIDATISSVFSTKHAISLTTTDGLEVLMHLGVDTVELKGAPFDIKVQEGQKVAAGNLLGTMDLKQVADAGMSSEIMVIFTNMNKIKTLNANPPANIQHGEEIGTITLA